MAGFIQGDFNKELCTDCKEIAPCGMKIRYTVDNTTDFITYCDINNRGTGKLSIKCMGCSWRGICKPSYGFDFDTIIAFDDEQMKIIQKAYDLAYKNNDSGTTIEHFVKGLAEVSICMKLMELAQDIIKAHEED